MNSTANNTATLVARILLAAIFIGSGIGKIAGFDGTAGYIASKGLPMPTLGAVMAILVELGCGIALVAGAMTRWAAAVLIAFTAIASFLFHNFWAIAPEQAMQVQQIHFMKNLAIIGGLLLLAIHGGGGLSVDARRAHLARLER